MNKDYDAIIVGARVAGSSLAYELGSAGYKVLLVDKGRFPSDVLSTHNFFNNSVAMLREMGILDRLLATGTPTYRRAYVRLEDAVIDGRFPEVNGETECLCIRRTELDRLLFEHAASLNTVTARQRFRVTGLLKEGESVHGIEGVDAAGHSARFTARIVIGADGRRSVVRSLAGSERRAAVPTDFASYVGYFAGFRQEGEPCTEFYKLGEYLSIVFPTGDGLHVVGLMFPLAWRGLLDRMGKEPERCFREAVESGFGETTFPERLRGTALVGPIRGLQGYDNDWFQAMGPGWALTGDALSFKDPAVGQGMHDALFGARLLKKVLGAYRDWDGQWGDMAALYEAKLKEKLEPMFHLACEMTRNSPYTPEQTAVNRLIGAHPQATAAFLGMYNRANEPQELGRVIGELMRGGASAG